MDKLSAIQLAMISVLFSCCGSHSDKENRNEKKETDGTGKSVIVRKPLNITSEFNQISNLGSIDIIYSQGDFLAELVGDSTLVNLIDADIDSNILSLSLKGERNKDINVYDGTNKITLELRTPNLKCVALCSNGSFRSTGTWKGQDIQLGIIGSGNFDIDTIECATFDYQATGTGTANIRHIISDAASVTCASASNVNADVNTETLKAASTSGKITITGKAGKKKIYESEDNLIDDKTTSANL